MGMPMPYLSGYRSIGALSGLGIRPDAETPSPHGGDLVDERSDAGGSLPGTRFPSFRGQRLTACRSQVVKAGHQASMRRHQSRFFGNMYVPRHRGMMCLSKAAFTTALPHPSLIKTTRRFEIRNLIHFFVHCTVI